MTDIAIFASGSGTNAEAMMKHFSDHDSIRITLVLTNRKDAGVIERAKRFNVPHVVFNREELLSGQVLSTLQENGIDFIVLAGFMMMIPEDLVKAYSDKMVNIHPALLPKYGGKGMYGHHVHEAVIAAEESESGISIHLVNERYDEGRILFQAKCPVLPNDDADSLAQRIHALEHKNYPAVVEEFIDQSS